MKFNRLSQVRRTRRLNFKRANRERRWLENIAEWKTNRLFRENLKEHFAETAPPLIEITNKFGVNIVEIAIRISNEVLKDFRIKALNGKRDKE